MTTQHTHDIDRTLPQQRGRSAPPPLTAVALVPATLAPQPRRPARRDVLAIKASLAAVQKEPVALAQSFYAHLFEMAPAARAMFASDMTAQMQRMTDVLLANIGALEDSGPGSRTPSTPSAPSTATVGASAPSTTSTSPTRSPGPCGTSQARPGRAR